MFSWICPQCGHEVPPSKTDCPYCAERAKESGAAGVPAGVAVAAAPPQFPPQTSGQLPVWQPPPPPQPAGYPPPYAQATSTPPPLSAPPYYAVQPPVAGWQPPPPPQRAATPTWLLGIGFAVAFVLILAAVYYGIQHFGSGAAEKAGVENPSNASRQKVSNPLQKYVEVTGLRMTTANKKPVAKFVVVNHATTEISGLAGNVTLWASTSRSEEDSVGSFSFTIPTLEPGASEELTEPLKTKLKMYELPDWQNATAELQITSPAAPQ